MKYLKLKKCKFFNYDHKTRKSFIKNNYIKNFL